MKTHFILIDFENVQPANLALLRGGEFKIFVFIGATQSKLPTDLACELQGLGSNAEYVRCAGSGPNTLDFHIAYYIGCLAAKHPEGSYYIISQDKGFDPLIKHLKTKSIACQRCASIDQLPGLKRSGPSPAAVPQKSGPVPVGRKVADNLARNPKARPRTLKKLSSFLKPFLGTTATESQIVGLVAELQRQGVVIVADGKVTYPGP